MTAFRRRDIQPRVGFAAAEPGMVVVAHGRPVEFLQLRNRGLGRESGAFTPSEIRVDGKTRGGAPYLARILTPRWFNVCTFPSRTVCSRRPSIASANSAIKRSRVGRGHVGPLPEAGPSACVSA